VRTPIDVYVSLAAPAHGEEFLAIDLEAAATGIGQFDAGTQKFHDGPQVPQG
jgi:hypothetical protein